MASVGLVIAQFYETMAEEMEDRAQERILERDAEITTTVYVPGVYDTPLAADRLARCDEIDAVTVLGAVVTGDTDHDQVVTHTAADKLGDVSLDRDTPVTFGVIGPDMSSAEAHERIEYAVNAVDAAVDTVRELPG
ncbi:6,7-dimethyl-8-ribityllumazine synthase [Halorubrum salsamenti]|uniref:6,7-dimethyl-8-ribityllumazine synthase n=1 Tax=Halorubrum salsamenti TaxID=2583990 RepID=UPI00119DC9BB|nr:6,7-dimethyl-8-ribityllumazine synthase [Halorubrum salsamenti]